MRRVSFGTGLVLGFLAIWPASSVAAECQAADRNVPSISAGTIRDTAPKTYFLKSGDGKLHCPGNTDECSTKAFVMPGDVVLTGPEQNGFLCTTFTNLRGVETTGWLPASSVAPLPGPFAPQPKDWAGRWVSGYDQDIDIKLLPDGSLKIKGNATWGGQDPDRVRLGAVHVGELDAQTKPDGDMVAFTMGDQTLRFDEGDPTDCRVRLVRRGPYLVAADNNNCGGANVTFSGTYRRKK